ncbi:MAG: histidine-type phosphatase [Myxococcota bacterium]|jgi:4-phytase/acid phosphatase
MKRKQPANTKDLVMQKPLCVGLMLCCLVACFLFSGCSGSGGNDGDDQLLSVVAISRHGIRSQTTSLADLNLFTQLPQGFPLWPTPANTPGNLSTWGKQNVTLLGAWYREFYAAQGLLPPKGSCPASGTVYVYADIAERTIQTAQGYLDGMFLGEATRDCGFQVVSSSAAEDPYFNTLSAQLCKVDTATDQAAFNTATGGNPDSLKTTYAAQLQTMQTVTQCCQPAACATPANPSPASCSLPELPSAVSVSSKTGAIGFGTLFVAAETVAEQFELEYAQGMPQTGCATTTGAQCVGWGAIPPGGMNDMMKLHVLYFDLIYRLPSYAQTSSSNLMWQLVGTMDQTLTGVKGTGMLAPVTSRFTLFVGHDDNQAAIGAFLGGVTWQAQGYQMDDPGPAGAFVFELHKVKGVAQPVVRLFYVIATLDQMRNGTSLSLQTPPQRIPLTIPACGGTDCPYAQFKTLITGKVLQNCLVTAASTL